MGTGKKSDFIKSTNKENPSPSSYNITLFIDKGLKDHKGPSIRIRLNDNHREENNTPGSGVYHSNEKRMNYTDIRSRLKYYYGKVLIVHIRYRN